MELHSIGEKPYGREDEGLRRTAFFPYRNTQSEQSERGLQNEGVTPVSGGYEDGQTPLPSLNTLPAPSNIAKSRNPPFAGHPAFPSPQPQNARSQWQKVQAPQEELGDEPPAKGGRLTGTVVQTAPPERDAFAAAAAGLAAALSPQSGAASAFSSANTQILSGLRKGRAADSLEPSSAGESAGDIMPGRFTRWGSANQRGGGAYDGAANVWDLQTAIGQGMLTEWGEKRGSAEEGVLQNDGRKSASEHDKLRGSGEGGVPDWDAALFGEYRSGRQESRNNAALLAGAPASDSATRARNVGVLQQEEGGAQRSTERRGRDPRGFGVDRVGSAGTGVDLRTRSEQSAAGGPFEGEFFQEGEGNGRSGLSDGQGVRQGPAAGQGTNQKAERGLVKGGDRDLEGVKAENRRREGGRSPADASWNAKDVLSQQTEMLALMQKQVDLLQALLVKQQPAAKAVTNPTTRPAVTTSAVNTSFLPPNPNPHFDSHSADRVVARRQVAEIGTNTSLAWPAPTPIPNGWNSVPVQIATTGAGEVYSQRGAKAGVFQNDEESEAFERDFSEGQRRIKGRGKDGKSERPREGGVSEVRAESTVQQLSDYRTEFEPDFVAAPPQAYGIGTAHRSGLDGRSGTEVSKPRQTASADVSKDGRGHASEQRPVEPRERPAGRGVRMDAATERPHLEFGTGGFDGGEPNGNASAQRGDVRGDVIEGEEQGWLSSRSSSASSLVLSELAAPLERADEDGGFESRRGEEEDTAHAQHWEREMRGHGTNERAGESLLQRREVRERDLGGGDIHERELGALRDGLAAVRNETGGVQTTDGGPPKAGAVSLEALNGFVAGRNGGKERDVGARFSDAGVRLGTSDHRRVPRKPTGKLEGGGEFGRRGERVEKAFLGSGWGAGGGAPVLKAHLLDIPQIKYVPLSDDDDSEAEETTGRFRTADVLPRGSFATNGGPRDRLGREDGGESDGKERANGVVPRGALRERGGIEKKRTAERSGSELTHDGSTYLVDLSVDSRRYLTQHGLLQTRSRPPTLKPLEEDRVLRNQDPDDSLEMSERGLETGIDSSVCERGGVWGESGGGVWEERSRVLRAAQIEECDSSMFLSGTEVRLAGAAEAPPLWATDSMAEGSTLAADVSRPGSTHSAAPPLAAEASGNLLEAVRRKRLPKLR
ncbi:hypothetical protein KFL_005750040 [Klebsormidium nitens]|uniref:Uncharacterized protein n=1 Tax=Klebsormidium nitens TaxID=105231 RepID=A0A1Y1IGY3_KLENI|nr:hypothetical protein KFL_005750040 [Klebsormidium nitens]|eukprot:GAQ89903.1 hypothetical protein KFL_005750040 [Klebsormidium nitens]